MADSTLLDDLYREIILDHYRQPRNRGAIETPSCRADGANPLCGDVVSVSLVLDADGRIADVRFAGQGCSISQASASMMTEFVRGRSADEARRAAEAFQRMMITGEPSGLDGFGDIDALSGVAKFPARVKCASLAWKTLEQALRGGEEEAVTTDERTVSHG